MADPVEEARSLPLDDRVVHQNWKVRLEAYEELEKKYSQALDGADSVFSNYSSLLKGIIDDKNVVAKEKGLAAVLVFVDRYDKAKQYTSVFSPSLVECLAGREKTKALATEVLLMSMEIDVLDPFIAELIQGAEHKVPKVAAASIAVIRESLRLFGIPAWPYRNVLKSFASWFDNSNKAVRDEAFALVLEMYRWLGAAMRKQTESLRHAQIKELTEAFDALPQDSPVAQRFLRSQVAKANSTASTSSQPSSSVEISAPVAPKVDSFDIFDPVEVLPKIDAIPFFEMIVSSKWKERKEQLDALAVILDAPKIRNGDFSAVVNALQEILHADANVFCVEIAVKCLGLLARGLRKEFSSHARGLCPLLFEKLKEKRPNVVNAILETFNQMHPHCYTLPDVIEEFTHHALKHKVPSVKQQALVVLLKYIAATPKPSLTKVLKTLTPAAISLFEDSDPKVRDSAYEVLGLLMQVMGEKAMQGYISQLDTLKMKLVKDKIPHGDATAACSTSSTTSSSSATAQSAPSRSAVASIAPATRPARQIPEHLTSKQPVASGPSTQKPAKKPLVPEASDPSTSAAIVEENMTSFDSFEAALSRVQGILSEELIVKLSEPTQWKLRLEGITFLAEQLAGTKEEVLAEQIQPIFAFLQHKPSFADSNFQVLQKVFSLLIHLANVSKAFTRRMAAVSVASFVEKLADVKVKPTSCEGLTLLAEVFTPQFVFLHIFKVTEKHKSPKVISEAISWMAKSISEFGMSNLEVKQLIDFSKIMLQSTNPQVKQCVVSLLCEMYKNLGEGLRGYLSDVKPALLATITKSLDELVGVKPEATIRTVRGFVAKTSNSSTVGGLPRTDISSHITSELLGEMGSSNWKERLEALEKVSKIVIAANKRVSSSLGGLLAPLTKRLSDNNNRVVVAAIALVAELVQAMGAGIQDHLRSLAPSLLQCFSDTKANTKAAALECMDKMVAEIGMDPFIPYLPTALNNPVGRKEVLAWATHHFPSDIRKKVDCVPLLNPIFACLSDKILEVRKLAETLLGEVAQRVDSMDIDSALNQLKPSFAQPIKATLSRIAQSAAVAVKAISQPQVHSARKDSAEQDSEDATSASEIPPTATPVAMKPLAPVAPVLPAVPIETSSDPVKRNTGKSQREAKWTQNPWPMSTLTVHYLQLMKDELRECVHFELLVKMFAEREEEWLDALDFLTDALVQNKEAMLESLDVVLKWSIWRLNPGTHSADLLIFIQNIIGFLSEARARMSDYEAAVFIPPFVDRVTKESSDLQTKMAETVRLLARVYPASKLFALFLTMAKKPGSSREVRVLALQELCALIQSQGIRVCEPGSDLPAIAALLDDSDKMIKSGALSALHTAHFWIQGEIWQHLTSVNEVHLDLLKIKFTENAPSRILAGAPRSRANSNGNSDAMAPPPSRLVQPGARLIQPPTVTPETPVDLELNDVPPTPAPSAPIARVLPSTANMVGETPQLPSRLTTRITSPGTQLEQWIGDVVESSSSPDVQHRLKTLNSLILAVKEREAYLLVLHLESLTDALSVHVDRMFDESLSENDSGILVRHVVMAIKSVLDKPETAKLISEQSVETLIKSLLHQALNSRMLSFVDGQNIKTVLAMVVNRVLESCSPSASLLVLLKELLVVSAPQSSNDERYGSYILKCLIKMSQQTQRQVDSLDLSKALLLVHEFLERFPPSFWKLQKEQTPLNLVKTLLQQWVSAKGVVIATFVDLIPVKDTQAPPQVIAYINQLLSELMKTEVDVLKLAQDNPSRQRGSTLIRLSEFRGISGALSREQIKAHLNVIFRRIGNKETSNQGLADLYCLTSEHSEVDIKPYLQRTALQFQQFIEKGLRDMAVEALQIDESVPLPAQSSRSRTAGPFTSLDNIDHSRLTTPSAKLRSMKERLGMSPAPLPAASPAPTFVPSATTATNTAPVTRAPVAVGATGTSLDTLRARLANIKKGNL